MTSKIYWRLSRVSAFSTGSLFSVRVDQLQSLCDFFKVEYRAVLYHSKTRFLSTFPAIQRILQLFEPLCYLIETQNSPAH